VSRRAQANARWSSWCLSRFRLSVADRDSVTKITALLWLVSTVLWFIIAHYAKITKMNYYANDTLCIQIKVCIIARECMIERHNMSILCFIMWIGMMLDWECVSPRSICGSTFHLDSMSRQR